MTMTTEEVIVDIQEQIFTIKGIRTDVYHNEGQGAHFILEGAEPIPPNVIIFIPEHVLTFGQKVTINF